MHHGEEVGPAHLHLAAGFHADRSPRAHGDGVLVRGVPVSVDQQQRGRGELLREPAREVARFPRVAARFNDDLYRAALWAVLDEVDIHVSHVGDAPQRSGDTQVPLPAALTVA